MLAYRRFPRMSIASVLAPQRTLVAKQVTEYSWLVTIDIELSFERRHRTETGQNECVERWYILSPYRNLIQPYVI